MKKGDWIETNTGEIFFIKEINALFVRTGYFYHDPETRKLECGGGVTTTLDVKPAELEGYSEQEIDFLINLALDTNDKEWFKELARKRELLSVNQ